MIFLGQAESFKTMNQPDLTVTFFDGLFLGKFFRYERAILPQSSFKSSKFGLDIFDSLKNMRLSAT